MAMKHDWVRSTTALESMLHFEKLFTLKYCGYGKRYLFFKPQNLNLRILLSVTSLRLCNSVGIISSCVDIFVPFFLAISKKCGQSCNITQKKTQAITITDLFYATTFYSFSPPISFASLLSLGGSIHDKLCFLMGPLQLHHLVLCFWLLFCFP